MKYRASKNAPTKEGAYYTTIWTFKGNIRSESCRIEGGYHETYDSEADLWRAQNWNIDADRCKDIYYLSAPR
jgi:hypothetical protein